MNQSLSPSYASMFLQERSAACSAQKQAIIEDIIFDYSKESSYTVKNVSGEEQKVVRNITFNPSICDLHAKEEPPCTKCIDSCEYSALMFDKNAKSLVINHALCVSCGKCSGACPTGAMQSAKFGFDAFVAILQSAEESTVLFAKEGDLPRIAGALPDDTVIVCVDEYAIFNELHLTIAALKSGGRAAFASKALLPMELIKSVEISNLIVSAKRGRNAVFFLDEEPPSFFAPLDARLENMSIRAAFGEVLKKSGEPCGGKTLNTGSDMVATVEVDKSCTLCMGCVFVCKSGAFLADEKDGALKLNSSLCTACGYCQGVCPEKSITVNKGFLSLKQEDCAYKVAAVDELFCCAECGKPFATKKAIDKVSNVFASLLWDEQKKKTLFCCSTCKPKVMLRDRLAKRAEAK